MVPGKIYHVYNRANGWENLFRERKNFIFFLQKVRRYIRPVARVYAYNLLPDHFHLLVRIRDQAELADYFELAEADQDKLEKVISKKLSKSFANLFSSYAQAYNKVYERIGSLFMQNMKVEEIRDGDEFCKIVHFIHANAVLHRWVKAIGEWPYSSYTALLQEGPTMLAGDFVLNSFGGRRSFLQYHRQPVDTEYEWLEEKGWQSRVSRKGKRKGKRKGERG